MYTVGSMFSGIGGLDLAAEWAGFRIEWQTDYDDYSMYQCGRNFPGAKQYRINVRELRGSNLATVDVVCGGPPCQPFSFAGNRRGTADDRHLWPEMLRVIRELDPQPRAVFFENVVGSADLLLAEVCADLENAGYTSIWPFQIPAAALGAPHPRDRIFVLAYTARSSKSHQRNIIQKISIERQFRTGNRDRSGNHASRDFDGKRTTTEGTPTPRSLGNTAGPRLASRAGINGNTEQKQPPPERTSNGGGRGDNAQPRLGIGSDGLSAWLVRPRWPAWRGQQQYDWEPPRTVESFPGRADAVAAIGNAVSPVHAYPFWFALMEELKRQDRDE